MVAKGWQNVHVVEADACTFTPPGETATLVTFSYSLSSAPSSLRRKKYEVLDSNTLMPPSRRRSLNNGRTLGSFMLSVPWLCPLW